MKYAVRMRIRVAILFAAAALAIGGCKRTNKSKSEHNPPAATADQPTAPAAAKKSAACASVDDCTPRCDGGDAVACRELGALLRHGAAGRDPDLARARATYEKACKAGDQPACAALGDMLLNGLGGDQNHARALQLSNAACAAGVGSGCQNAGIMHLVGAGVAVDKDAARDAFARAAKAFQPACDGGDADACADLGLLHERGLVSAGDATSPLSLYEKSCTGGSDKGCVTLANALVAGKITQPDPQRAIGLLTDACNRGAGEACNQLGRFYMNGAPGIGQSSEQAYAMFQKACDNAYAPGCGTMAELMMDGQIKTGGPAQALKLYQRSCKLGDTTGCYRMGQMSMVDPSPENVDKAIGYYGQACNMGMGPACRELAGLIKSKEPDRAKELRALACRLGDTESCD